MKNRITICLLFLLHLILMPGIIQAAGDWIPSLELPDALIVEAYEQAARKNVLAAVNPAVFPGYWSVCADGKDYGYGYTYPSLDGHQMTDALLWLGQMDTVKANWDYVKTFQKPDGQLPLAIFPDSAGKWIGPATAQAQTDMNGGLYRHWVPGDPLRALAGPTYIQNAYEIFRFTLDREWLAQQISSVNLAADFLSSLTTDEGAVGGAGYYMERPTRVEYDGVAQCHAVDAFRRAVELNEILGNRDAVEKYRALAKRIESHFRTRFWLKDRFAEYIHPERGTISSHGLTDTDWSAIALGVADTDQCARLWPLLKNEKRFYYGGMPTGIAVLPKTYEPWETTYPDMKEIAAMGRVWILEAGARARMGDSQGLVDSIRRVCETGRKEDYFWRERYDENGGFGVLKYCEYPANLIRIVQRYLLGVELRLDGTVVLSPVVPEEYWMKGFGQALEWRDRHLQYRMQRNRIAGTYWGGEQRLGVKTAEGIGDTFTATINGKPATTERNGRFLFITLPAASPSEACRFEIGDGVLE